MSYFGKPGTCNPKRLSISISKEHSLRLLKMSTLFPWPSGSLLLDILLDLEYSFSKCPQVNTVYGLILFLISSAVLG